jgi:hypothetical protein
MQNILDAPDIMLIAGLPITRRYVTFGVTKQVTLGPHTMIHIKDLLKELQRNMGLLHNIRIIPVAGTIQKFIKTNLF